MTAHVTMPPRRSPAGGSWWVALCSCQHQEHGDDHDQALDAIKAHQAEAQEQADVEAARR